MSISKKPTVTWIKRDSGGNCDARITPTEPTEPLNIPEPVQKEAGSR